MVHWDILSRHHQYGTLNNAVTFPSIPLYMSAGGVIKDERRVTNRRESKDNKTHTSRSVYKCDEAQNGKG